MAEPGVVLPAARRIVVLGASGQLGQALCRQLAPLGEVIPVARTGTPTTLDPAQPESLRACLEALKPALIVNAAAYTAVDRAESEPALAHAINATAVGVLGEIAARAGVPLIHYSTDYVFDGSGEMPRYEDEPCAPLNVYGLSKRAGEEALFATDAACLVFRTSWVYAARGQNFLRTVLRLARAGTPLRIVDDQHGAPSWASSIALATALIVHQLGFSVGDYRAQRGLYHLTNAGETTWHGFAREILRRLPEGLGVATREIQPIATTDYPTPAVRPRNSRLDGSKLYQQFGLRPEAWEQALARCLEDLAPA